MFSPKIINNNYCLVESSLSYINCEPEPLSKGKLKIQSEMEAQIFDGLDGISIICLLHPFDMNCEDNRIHGVVAMSLFLYYMSNFGICHPIGTLVANSEVVEL